MRDNVEASIQEKTKDLQKLTPLRVNVLKSAVTWEGMAEHEPLMAEIDKVLANNEEIKIKQNQINQIRNTINEFNENRDKHYADYEKQIQQANINFNNIEQKIREHNQNSDWGNSSWSNRRRQLYDQRVNIFYDRFAKFEDKTSADLSKISKIDYEISSIRNSASSQARENLVKAVEDAQTQYEQIVAEETKDLTDLENKVSGILKEIPTFEADAESISGLDPVMLRAKLVDLTNFGNTNEEDAVYYARIELEEIGLDSVSKYMTGPRWEASNIKTAAIVRSKKYSFVDDYEYVNALYNDPIPITNASDREMVEEGIREVLGGSNVVIDALNSKIERLSAKLNLTEEQSKTLTSDIVKLETELSSLKTSEQEIQNQISDLSNQFSSKESLIVKKTTRINRSSRSIKPFK